MPQRVSRNRQYNNDSDFNDHFYQNQNERVLSHLAKKNKKLSRNLAKLTKLKTNTIIATPNYKQFKEAQKISSALLSTGALSSSASSERPLITKNEEKRANLLYSLLVVAIYCLIMSLIAIAVTYIFPFWLLIEIEPQPLENASSFNRINITNRENLISLLTIHPPLTHQLQIENMNMSEPISFDIGIWEVKMHQELEFYDLNSYSSSRNSYPQTMLWLNIDANSAIQSFLIRFSQYINIKSVYLFVIQILEIMHLVFTFLTLCFTSFTLCLCSNKSSSLCWYFVCFFMSMISLLSGASVCLLIYSWQMSPSPQLRNINGHTVKMVKSLNWCFWVAVGLNASIVLASLLILVYIIAVSILISIRRNKKYKQYKQSISMNMNNQSTLSNKLPAAMIAGAHLLPLNNISSKSINGKSSPNRILSSELCSNSHLYHNTLAESQPHLVASYSSGFPRQSDSSLAIVSNPNILINNINESKSAIFSPERNETQLKDNSDSQLNASYIFYTGHGNYHKQSFVIDPNSEKLAYYEPLKDLMQPNNILGYSMMMQYQQQNLYNNTKRHMNKVNANNDHPYSNVNDPN
jgi:hypothetical protein